MNTLKLYHTNRKLCVVPSTNEFVQTFGLSLQIFVNRLEMAYINPFPTNVPIFSGGIEVEHWLKMG